MELIILHTNDIHSNFENYAKIVTKMKGLKDENTLIIDAGDFADFKRMELLGTKGKAAVDLLEVAGYDAIAIGNNETFNGLESLSIMGRDGRIPFLGCNIEKINGDRIEGIFKSVIVNKGLLRILIIGTSPSIGPFDELIGLNCLDVIKCVKEEVDNHHGQYDICVVLSHVGMDLDRELAHEVPQIDVIIGGHFHILMDEAELVGSCIIHSAGQYGEHLGVVKILIGDEGATLISSENICVKKEEMDSEVKRVLKCNKEKALDALTIPLYKIEKDLWHDVLEENPITNVVADGLLDLYKCDFAIINSGVLNSGIPKGNVDKLKLLEIAPSPLNPCMFQIEGKYIVEALKLSLDGDKKLESGAGPGFRGRFLGKLHVSSNVEISHNNRSIIDVKINGDSILLDKKYKVATSDYLHRGTGYSPLMNNENVEYDNMYIRDLLEKILINDGVVEEALKSRWKFEE